MGEVSNSEIMDVVSFAALLEEMTEDEIVVEGDRAFRSLPFGKHIDVIVEYAPENGTYEMRMLIDTDVFVTKDEEPKMLLLARGVSAAKAIEEYGALIPIARQANEIFAFLLKNAEEKTVAYVFNSNPGLKSLNKTA